MSDNTSHAASDNHDELFSPVEIEQFGADDVTAGGVIGKMLSALFLYTVLAMGIAGWWTYSSIEADKAAAQSNQNGADSAAELEHGSTAH